MDPLSVTLPPKPAVSVRALEADATLTFGTFVEAVEALLKTVRARLEQRQEDHEGAAWWLTFNRASCLYRVTGDRRAEALRLEKVVGSFIPNSQPAWRPLDIRPQSDPAFEVSLPLLKEMLNRFVQT